MEVIIMLLALKIVTFVLFGNIFGLMFIGYVYRKCVDKFGKNELVQDIER